MTTPPGGNPFEMIFSQLGRMLSTAGPVNWEMAAQFAQWTATEGNDPGNVDPLERIRLEELVRVADLNVSHVTGMSTSATGRSVTVRPVTRLGFAVETLEAWKPLLGALAAALQPPATTDTPTLPDDLGLGGEMGAGLGQMLGPLLPGLQSAFMGMQCGSMVGSVAQRALGQYDLPIPRPVGDELLVVTDNVTAFTSDWGLPPDEVRLWICISDVAHHAVLGRPHVRASLEELLLAYMSGFDPGGVNLEGRLADLDPADPEALQSVLGDPTALLGEMQTEAQRAILPRLEALVAVIEGYVDHVVDQAGRRLISSYGPLTEALRRRRVERGQGERMVERLFGLALGQGQYDRGTSFVSGVLERAGDTALSRLWTDSHALPTPSELDAPGLWLERIDLPRDD
ncbi:MAG: zinc-dependent metalloprotease [Acidimicrobiales bacterium]